MKKIILIISTVAILLGCNQKQHEYFVVNGFTQGTTFRIVYQGEKDYKLEIDSILKAFDLSLSTYNKQSVITKINQNDPDVVADIHFKKFYRSSYEIWSQTDGAFDITIAPVVNAWGFGFTDSANVNQEIIDSILQFVGMEKTHFEDGKVTKDSPGIKFDSNAIAQGQSVDVVADFLKQRGIVNYMVEIGGEVKAEGKNAKSKLWRIGVDKPIDDPDATNRELKAVIALENKALATSGNYRKFYIRDGVKYSHTIDPKTGYPVNHSLLSVTVVASDCTSADGYATAFMVMGFDKTVKFLASHPELTAYLIADDSEGGYIEFISEGLKKYIEEM